MPLWKVLIYNRSPRSFRDALLLSPALEAFRRPLQEAGLGMEHVSRAKIFVRPDEYHPVLQAITGQHLGSASRPGTLSSTPPLRRPSGGWSGISHPGSG